VNCPACGQENPDRAKFCLECGAAFAARCARCHTELPARAKFCLECGAAVGAGESPVPDRAPRDYTPNHLAEKILQSKSALEGERKQVTVLFADVKGSLELAEQVDAEEWHRILDRFFHILADGVHRFEGTVNQYTGDGIMALFGAPIAHEDHAQRACYAALHLRDELRRYADELRLERGLDFSVRMGLNSGDVVVGKIGDDLRMDYTAQGQTVGLAARVERIAGADRICLSEGTAGLVAGYFDLESLGAVQVKGVSQPVRVHELKGPGALRTRFDLSRARGLTRFVGRDRDMEALDAALEAGGRVVGVVGEAGVGKSRLCFEFVERCRARGIRANEGRAVPHGKNIPMLPMLQIFRAYYGIAERDTDRAVREKIAGRMLLIDESFREVLPLLFEFFGAPDPERPAPRMDPEARQRQIVGVLRRLVQSDEAAVTLIEDLHWIDSASEALLEAWVDAIAGAKGLLLLNFRPEYHADWMQKSWYQQLPLAPLGPEAIGELLGDLLGGDASVSGLAEAIRGRTAGSPFFTEEVVQSLVESGHLEGRRGHYRLATPIERIEVPGTVRAVLAARIDRLAEREKEVLQTAAVIGREFSEPVLEAVADLPGRDLSLALAALKNAEFLYEQALYPVAEYAFKHPLTQEVAYGSQLGERRRRVHASVARAIEGLEADRLDERAALLAHHWESAGEPLDAARWSARAAEWARANDPAECMRQWRRVRELAENLGDLDEAVSLRMQACLEIAGRGGWRLGLSGEEVEALFAEARRLGEQRGDARYLVQLAFAYLTVLGPVEGDIRAYVEQALEVQRLAEQLGDLELQCVALLVLNYSHIRMGCLAESLAYMERAIELTGGDRTLGVPTLGFSVYVFGLHARAGSKLNMGRLAEARRELVRAVEVAREAGEAENLGWALNQCVQLEILAGAFEKALEHAAESLEVAEKTGSPFSQAHALNAMGDAQIHRGLWKDAVESLQAAIDLARDRHTATEIEANLLVHLADAYRGDGQLERAREIIARALALVDERGARFSELEGNLVLARVLMDADGAAAEAAATEALDGARDCVEEFGARAWAPVVLVERARLAQLLRDDDARRAHLREAHRLYTEMGATGHAERLARELSL
jgi:class 3 adenylate cyclase/tetratricopeptide (TPR) repeat protein